MSDDWQYTEEKGVPHSLCCDSCKKAQARVTELEAALADAKKWRHMHDAAAKDWREELERREAAEALIEEIANLLNPVKCLDVRQQLDAIKTSCKAWREDA